MLLVQQLDHLWGTYTRMRRGMAVIALLLPLVLWIGGVMFFNTPLQPSISAYYHTVDSLRDILVGALFAIAAFLFLYKGDNPREDRLLNLAGASAFGIALFETAKGDECAPDTSGFTVHGLFTVMFFAAITVVCVMAALRPPEKEGRPRDLAHHTTYYFICAALMLAGMLAGLVYTFLLPASVKQVLCNRSITFWAEAVGVWAFSAFWLLRTWELDATVPWLPWRKKAAR
jgi:hypothetical protein